jgi:hypothetical protein
VSLKFVEVLVLVFAGALFFWWQSRDLRLAREKSRRDRAATQAKASTHLESSSGSPGSTGGS